MRQKKSVDPAEVQRRLAVLEPQLEKLQQQAEAEQDPKKKLKLGKKVDQVRDKIRQAKTGERFSRQTKRDLVAYSFIAPNFIGFAVFTLGPVIFAFILAFIKWDGNNPMQFAALDNFCYDDWKYPFPGIFKEYDYLLCCNSTILPWQLLWVWQFS